MSYYRHHMFFCVNKRDDGRACCANQNAQAVRDYAKAKVKALGQDGPGKIRVNMSGCLDRCAEGPIIVIYPDGIWYTYVDKKDVDEIIDRHLLGGDIVERLRI